MPAPSKKTASRMQRVLELHREGASAREIAEQIGIDQKTIRSWLADAGLEANGGAGPRAARKRAPRPPAEVREAVRDATTRAAEVLANPPTQADGVEGVKVVEARIRSVTALLDKMTPDLAEGKADAQLYTKLLDAEGKLATVLKGLQPPTPPDPELDMTNQEAAENMRRKLTRLVAEAEQNATCVHCGKPPFAPTGT